MTATETIESDNAWISMNLSVFLRDYAIVASSNTKSYNKEFLPSSDYIAVKLRAVHRDYSTATDAKYYANLRLMLNKLVIMLGCLSNEPEFKSRVLMLHRNSTLVDSKTSFNLFKLQFAAAMSAILVTA